MKTVSRFINSAELEPSWLEAMNPIPFVMAIIKERTILWHTTKIQFSEIHRDDIFGGWWVLIQPLLLVLLYAVVFSVLIPIHGKDSSPGLLPLSSILIGVSSFMPISHALGFGPSLLINQAGFVKRVVFPIETIPVASVLAGFFTALFLLSLGIIGCLYSGAKPTLLGALYSIISFSTLPIASCGLIFALSSLSLYIRDIRHFCPFIVQAVFFTSPVIINRSVFPKSIGWVIDMNPLTSVISVIRQSFIEGKTPALKLLLIPLAIAIILFLFGQAIFRKLRHGLADVI